MTSFFMEYYAYLKWVKKGYSLPQILKLSVINVSKEVLLTGLKTQVKILSHSRGCVLGEGQLCGLPLMT